MMKTTYKHLVSMGLVASLIYRTEHCNSGYIGGAYQSDLQPNCL